MRSRLASPRKHLVVSGAAVGLGSLTNFRFDPNKPHTCCRICGDVYQTRADRRLTLYSPHQDHLACTEQRRQWSIVHASTHAAREHLNLELSGNWCTPEAAQRLAAFGVICLTDMVLSTEHSEALASSSSIPTNEPEEKS